MKNWKHCIIVGILTIAMAFTFIGCNNMLSGTWELDELGSDFRKLYQDYGYPFTEITFSGKNYTTDGRYRGTYSISGNQIELKDSDGDIEVLSFSRSENTITIDGAMFRRK